MERRRYHTEQINRWTTNGRRTSFRIETNCPEGRQRQRLTAVEFAVIVRVTRFVDEPLNFA
jgi:hypothetical protein